MFKRTARRLTSDWWLESPSCFPLPTSAMWVELRVNLNPSRLRIRLAIWQWSSRGATICRLTEVTMSSPILAGRAPRCWIRFTGFSYFKTDHRYPAGQTLTILTQSQSILVTGLLDACKFVFRANFGPQYWNKLETTFTGAVMTFSLHSILLQTADSAAGPGSTTLPQFITCMYVRIHTRNQWNE